MDQVATIVQRIEIPYNGSNHTMDRNTIQWIEIYGPLVAKSLKRGLDLIGVARWWSSLRDAASIRRGRHTARWWSSLLVANQSSNRRQWIEIPHNGSNHTMV